MDVRNPANTEKRPLIKAIFSVRRVVVICLIGLLCTLKFYLPAIMADKIDYLIKILSSFLF
jgi:hypothetical protein